MGTSDNDQLDLLARRFKLHRELVGSIYSEEHARLLANARITTYTPILALNVTRDRLRQLSHELRTARSAASGLGNTRVAATLH